MKDHEIRDIVNDLYQTAVVYCKTQQLRENLANVIVPHLKKLNLLEQKAFAFDDWIERTNWVQEQNRTFPLGSLGKHRADVMREEIERLRKMLLESYAREAKEYNELLQELNKVRLEVLELTQGLKERATALQQAQEQTMQDLNCQQGFHEMPRAALACLNCGAERPPQPQAVDKQSIYVQHRVVINDAVCGPWQDLPEIQPPNLAGVIEHVKSNELGFRSLREAGTFEHKGQIFNLGDRNQFKLPVPATEEELNNLHKE